MLAVVVLGADEVKRRALEQRLSAIGGFAVRSRDGGPEGGPESGRRVDVVVVAADRDGFGLARRVAARAVVAGPPALLVIDEPFEELVSVLWLGACGVILSSASDRDLADCTVLTAHRGFVMSDQVLADERLHTGGLAFAWTVSQDSKDAFDALSQRELEVLRLVGTGRSNSEIAERLWLSGNTVRSHVQRLMRKLGIRNRVCLIIFAYELGLVNVEDVVCSGGDRRDRPCTADGGSEPGPSGSHPVHAPDHGLQDRAR